MHIARHILLLVLAFVLQTTWIALFEIGRVHPDLILLVLVYIALRVGPLEATIHGFWVGLLQDVYMPADLGLNALANSLVGFAVGYGRSRVVADNIRIQVAFVCCTVLVHDLLYYALSSAIALSQVPYFWMRYSLGRALYSGLLGVLLSYFLLLRRRLFPV